MARAISLSRTPHWADRSDSPSGPAIAKHIPPHSLLHSFITAALDAGVPSRDVQIAARHADPRTTTRYDQARNNLDRHAAYDVTAFVVSVMRP